VGVAIVSLAAIALYFILSYPDKWWSIPVLLVGPIAMWVASRIGRSGHDNENLIRQLRPLVKEVGELEELILTFARHLLGNKYVIEEVGRIGVQGWQYYIESIGDHQQRALSSLKKELEEVDPFEESHIVDVVGTLGPILGRVLGLESHLSRDLCRNIKNAPAEDSSGWDNIKQTHQRLGMQLESLKPILSEKGRGDLFDTFVKNPPQNLRVTT